MKAGKERQSYLDVGRHVWRAMRADDDHIVSGPDKLKLVQGMECGPDNGQLGTIDINNVATKPIVHKTTELIVIRTVITHAPATTAVRAADSDDVALADTFGQERRVELVELSHEGLWAPGDVTITRG